MTNEEAERARVADNNRLKEEVDRKLSSKELEQEQKARSSERKQQREAATTALQSGNVNLQEIARQGGSLGRKIEREVRRFEATGRVSSWLAGETLKAEAAQNAAQQSAFRQAVVDVVSTIQTPLLLTPTSPIFLEDLHEKPEIKDDVDGGGGTTRQPWDILVENIPDSNDVKLKVVAGLVSNILPSNWDDEWTANDSSMYFAKVIVSTDGQHIDGATIEISTSQPSPQESEKFAIPSTIEFVFGIFYQGIRYRTIPFGNFTLRPRPWLTVEKTGSNIGDLPYEIYYKLLT
jgi:hypothetical protein